MASHTVQVVVVIDDSRLVQALAPFKEQIMTALENLQAADADLAVTVAGLVAGVNRLEADFVGLQQAVQNGDSASIDAETAKVRDAIAALKGAADSVAAVDPAPAGQADGTVV